MSTRGWVTPLGWGLLSVAVARVEPERAEAQPKAWFSISFPYRKPRTGTNRTLSRGVRRDRIRRVATDREQNPGAEHRRGGAPSAER